MTLYELDPELPWSYIRGFQPVSLCDWPGHISCVLFFGGCNLRCPTCHNSQIAWDPIELPPIPSEKIFSFLQKRKVWLDGIVLTGGEPSQVPKLGSLISELKTVGLPIKFDTNGLEPELVKTFICSELIDIVAVDIKAPWSKYPDLTGGKCSEERARISLSYLLELAQDWPEYFYFRTTWVPKLSQPDIEEIRSYLPQKQTLHLQDYVPPEKHSKTNSMLDFQVIPPKTETNPTMVQGEDY